MFCKKCGKEIADNSTFCSVCGAKQTDTYQEVFVRNGLSESDFIANINKWFQWHPKAANVTCRFDANTTLGAAANQYALNRFVIEYELSEEENWQYGLVKEESVALVREDIREYIARWQQERPNVNLVQWTGGTHSRGHILSHFLNGTGAVNRMNVYILFRFPRRQQN